MEILTVETAEGEKVLTFETLDTPLGAAHPDIDAVRVALAEDGWEIGDYSQIMVRIVHETLTPRGWAWEDRCKVAHCFYMLEDSKRESAERLIQKWAAAAAERAANLAKGLDAYGYPLRTAEEIAADPREQRWKRKREMAYRRPCDEDRWENAQLGEARMQND